MKNRIMVMGCLGVLLVLTSLCFAGDVKTLAVAASVPQANGLTVSISKVVGTTWTPGQTGVDFGTLSYDAVNNIFTSPAYYAVDIGINSNALSWTLTHTRNSVANGTNSLDNHINVTFMKQNNTTPSQLSKVSFANSNNVSFTNTQFAVGDWLRAYYGIATGDLANDAPSTTPVPVTKVSGAYSGSVTYTLTP